MPAAVARLPEALRARIRIAQQVPRQVPGGALEQVQADYRDCGVDADLAGFFDDMPARLARAHLVICRAGASTVAELASARRPAILVPFPHATDDHQTANARALVDVEAGWLIPESDLTPEALAGQLETLINTPARLELAAARAGVGVGNFRTPVNRTLREFKEELTVLLIGLLFVLLAADVRLADVRTLGWAGVGVVAVLVLVVRPLGVLLSTAGSSLTRRERLLIAWLAPRGIVAAAIASVTANALEAHALPGGPELRALVFLTIAGTVLLAGLTAAPVASLLGLRQPRRNGIAILGAQGLGLALARELRRAELPVQFQDSNPQSSRRAEEAEFPVIFGNALDERTLQRARLEAVGSVVGLTANEALNGVFVRRARELFGVPERYVALASFQEGITPELLRDDDARVLFDSPHDVERWDVRSHHGEMTVERFRFEPPEPEPAAEASETPAGAGERYVLLCITRGTRTFPMYAGLSPEAGDVAAIALHTDEQEAAVGSLRELGWIPEDPESEP